MPFTFKALSKFWYFCTKWWIFVFYVETGMVPFASTSSVFSAIKAHDWIFPLPNMVKITAPTTLIRADTQNTFVQPARVCWKEQITEGNFSFFFLSHSHMHGEKEMGIFFCSFTLTSSVKNPVIIGATTPGIVPNVLVIPRRNPANLSSSSQFYY